MVDRKARDWNIFCHHMREAIVDERKAVPDYKKLIREADKILSGSDARDFRLFVKGIISDEDKHKKTLVPFFDKICPRTAFHRKGVE